MSYIISVVSIQSGRPTIGHQYIRSDRESALEVAATLVLDKLAEPDQSSKKESIKDAFLEFNEWLDGEWSVVINTPADTE